MADKPKTGDLFGIPYNFDRPSIRRMLSSYWQPGRGMLVEKPFGVGYTLNLASWRSWLVVGLAAALYWHEQTGGSGDGGRRVAASDEEPVEVVVDDD